MTDVSHKGFAAESFFAGALLLFCALTFYYFSVLRIDYHKTALLDLGPYPDAAEYFAQAKTLLKDGWPSIQIGYDKLPPRYPFGYPALIVPWLNVLPTADAVLSTVPDEPIVGSASSFGSVRLLCVSRDAANRWVCRAFARDTSGFLHFLSLVNERNHRISASCICVHVRIPGPEGGTPLEDLRVSRFSRSLPKHPNTVAFLYPVTAGNGFLPGERQSPAVAASLRYTSDPFPAGG